MGQIGHCVIPQKCLQAPNSFLCQQPNGGPHLSKCKQTTRSSLLILKCSSSIILHGSARKLNHYQEYYFTPSFCSFFLLCKQSFHYCNMTLSRSPFALAHQMYYSCSIFSNTNTQKCSSTTSSRGFLNALKRLSYLASQEQCTSLIFLDFLVHSLEACLWPPTPDYFLLPRSRLGSISCHEQLVSLFSLASR